MALRKKGGMLFRIPTFRAAADQNSSQLSAFAGAAVFAGAALNLPMGAWAGMRGFVADGLGASFGAA